MLKPLCIVLFLSGIWACNKRQTDNGFICVCDENSCDTVPGIDDLTADKIKVYTTSATEPGFSVSTVGFINSESTFGTKVRINSGTHQKIIGFGGAFTDSAAMEILSLPAAAQNKLLESYFGDEGIGYNLNRVPIGGSDFSPRPYTLDDNDGDDDLSMFSLQPEDLNYKIPIIKQAQALRGGKPFNLFGSYWTPPLWMKTKPVWAQNYSKLKDEYYQLFATYLKKFFDGYLKEGLQFWGLTTGNEPTNGFSDTNPVPSMSWIPTDQARWIIQNLGPTLRNSIHNGIKIIIVDDNIAGLAFNAPSLLENETTVEFIDGVATHWYSDGNYNPEMKLLSKSSIKDTFTISSEACFFVTHPLLGDWGRATQYINNIFEDLLYGYNGWVDWNLAVNSTGGYTWIKLPADGAVVVSEDHKEFYKQPLFYVIGHFSKFVIPDSVRQDITEESTYDVIHSISITRPDNVRVVIVHNSWTTEGWVQVIDGNKFSDMVRLPPKSLTTIVYRI